MPVDAIDQTRVTDEQIEKDETRLNELYQKERDGKLTEEAEKKEFEELKPKAKVYAQKKIDKLKWQQAKERERAETAERELERIRQENESLKKTTPKKPDFKKETINVGEEVYYSDRTLSQMIENKEITEEEAITHQQERLSAISAEKAYLRIKNEERVNEHKKLRSEDAQEVLKAHPKFDKTHPDHDPTDPLFKKASEIWMEGGGSNHPDPKWLSKSLKLAKEVLGHKDNVHLDVTDDLTVERGEPSQRQQRTDKITLTDEEKEDAIRMWTRGDISNPKTGRPYTDDEAIARALKSKTERAQKKGTR